MRLAATDNQLHEHIATVCLVIDLISKCIVSLLLIDKHVCVVIVTELYQSPVHESLSVSNVLVLTSATIGQKDQW